MARQHPQAKPVRQQLIQLVHVGCTKLGMDEETRRQWQQGVTGFASCSDMSTDQLLALVGLLRARGGLRDQPGPARREHEWSFVDRAIAPRAKLLRKIIMQAKNAGIPRGQQKRYVEGIAKQMLGQQADTRLEICGEQMLYQIVQALQVHLNRKGEAV